MAKHICENCGKEFDRDHQGSRNSKKLFCSFGCYGKWQTGKTFKEQNKRERDKRLCAVDGCPGKHFGKGFCRKHYIENVFMAREQPTKIANRVCAHCGQWFYDSRKNAKFCSVLCSANSRKKPFVVKNGYKKILLPQHHRADGKGYVMEHIIIAESIIGRRLDGTEEIHHIDGNKMNNSKKNIHVCSCHSEHMRFHNGHQRRPLCSKE